MGFENYLKEVHAKEYMGTDDDMPDAFDNWLGDLAADEFINYADEYAAAVLKDKVNAF